MSYSPTLLEPVADPSEHLDPVKEMRLRTWARVNYTPAEQRDTNWHPVILDEMRRKDRDLS